MSFGSVLSNLGMPERDAVALELNISWVPVLAAEDYWLK